MSWHKKVLSMLWHSSPNHYHLNPLDAGKDRKRSQARSIVRCWAMDWLGISQTQLAQIFNHTQPAISQAVRRGRAPVKPQSYSILNLILCTSRKRGQCVPIADTTTNKGCQLMDHGIGLLALGMHFLTRRGRLFGIGCRLLHHLFHLGDSPARLLDSLGLLIRSRGDFAYQFVYSGCGLSNTF